MIEFIYTTPNERNRQTQTYVTLRMSRQELQDLAYISERGARLLLEGKGGEVIDRVLEVGYRMLEINAVVPPEG